MAKPDHPRADRLHESVFPDGRSSLAAMIDSSTPHA